MRRIEITDPDGRIAEMYTQKIMVSVFGSENVKCSIVGPVQVLNIQRPCTSSACLPNMKTLLNYTN